MFHFASQVKDEYLCQIFFLQSFVAYCDGHFREAALIKLAPVLTSKWNTSVYILVFCYAYVPCSLVPPLHHQYIHCISR